MHGRGINYGNHMQVLTLISVCDIFDCVHTIEFQTLNSLCSQYFMGHLFGNSFI